VGRPGMKMQQGYFDLDVGILLMWVLEKYICSIDLSAYSGPRPRAVKFVKRLKLPSFQGSSLSPLSGFDGGLIAQEELYFFISYYNI
jgi:hypothetical protein